MPVDADLQVWLDSQYVAGQMIVVPYIRTAGETQVHYQLKLIQQGIRGQSNIGQSGTVKTEPASATPLSRITITPDKDGECRIEVTLHEGKQLLGNYRFNCQG